MVIGSNRLLRFNHDVVVNVFHVGREHYDFEIYTDIHKEYVEKDFTSYRQVLDKVNIIPDGLYTRPQIMQVLREIQGATNEKD